MTSVWRTSFWLMLGASLVLFLSLGIRHGFGLFLTPMSQSFGWGREVFAFALAFQNLAWGIAQPFAGAFADRYGARRTIALGGVFYTVGLLLMANADSAASLTVSAGLLIGIGLSGTSFSVLLGVVGRAVAPEQRSMAMGAAAAAGSLGQFLMLPGTMGLIQWLGWAAALLALGLLASLIVPVAAMVRIRSIPSAVASASTETAQTLGESFKEAIAVPGFWLLSLGFFVCGFQVVFIGVHLPAFLVDRGLAPLVGTTVLALVGLFNVFGTYAAGWLGGRHSKPKLLAVLYLVRAIVIALFVMIPVSTVSAYAFGILMGLLWLSTVPLTNGTVATMFGVRNLSMLGGVVFFMHQVGGFLGGWLGGLVYDRTGSYDLVWLIAIALSLMAAALNWPVQEKPVARLAAGSA